MAKKSFKTKDGEEVTVAGGRCSAEDLKKFTSALARVLGVEDGKEK